MKRFTTRLISADIYLLVMMNNKFRCSFFDYLMPLITHLGGAIFTISFTSGLIVFGNFRRLGFEVLISLSLSHLIVHFLKRKFNRPRPHTVLEVIEKFNVPICNYSFPSGHTTAAFAIANILAVNIPQFYLIFLGLASLVAISRMYLGVHYPSDILAGISIATTVALLTHSLFN